jgi:hypothetical protein
VPMRAACERAKIDPPADFHCLRHTWASHAAMNGIPLMVVAKNLGHAIRSYIADASGPVHRGLAIPVIRGSPGSRETSLHCSVSIVTSSTTARDCHGYRDEDKPTSV